MKQSEIDAICSAPAQHRELTPLPDSEYGDFQRGLRRGLLIAGVLWVVIFIVGAMVAQLFAAGAAP